MKRTLNALILTALIFPATAQVQIKPLPKPGFEQRIREYVDNMKVVDTHEHLLTPGFIKEHNNLDFTWLFIMYLEDDIRSAGMPKEKVGYFDRLFKPDTMTVRDKWRELKPYWEAASNTAYCRAMLLTADKLYGVNDINEQTVETLSEKIKEAYKNPEKWYYDVLKDKCHFEYVVKDNWDYQRDAAFDQSMFRFVKRFDNLIFINSKGDLDKFKEWKSSGVNTLDDLEVALEGAFKEAKEKGMVAIKSTLAYDRIISYSNVKKEQAEEVFNKLKNSSNNDRLPFDEVKPLQDYIMHRVLDLADKNHLPVQIHTGLQSGWHGNYIENSKPTLLVNLFQEYPNVKFILFHGSYPYGGELATLAKNFRNVYIDLCWLYIISPSYSERYLHEWLETVPANKIMAFGGDYCNLEGIYGHLLMAKQVISNVLIAKVRDGYFTEAEALKVAQMILHDNAIKILNLKN